MSLALLKPSHIAQQYIEAMKGYYVAPHRRPRYINLNARNLNELLLVPRYPLLKPQQNWTRNDLKYCSSYNPNIRTNLVTNLIDGKIFICYFDLNTFFEKILEKVILILCGLHLDPILIGLFLISKQIML